MIIVYMRPTFPVRMNRLLVLARKRLLTVRSGKFIFFFSGIGWIRVNTQGISSFFLVNKPKTISPENRLAGFPAFRSPRMVNPLAAAINCLKRVVTKQTFKYIKNHTFHVIALQTLLFQ